MNDESLKEIYGLRIPLGSDVLGLQNKVTELPSIAFALQQNRYNDHLINDLKVYKAECKALAEKMATLEQENKDLLADERSLRNSSFENYVSLARMETDLGRLRSALGDIIFTSIIDGKIKELPAPILKTLDWAEMRLMR